MTKLKRLFSVIIIVMVLMSSLGLSFAREAQVEGLENYVGDMVLVENGIPRVITYDELLKEYSHLLVGTKSDVVDTMKVETETVDDFGDIIPMSTTWTTFSESSGSDSIRFSESKNVTPWIHGGQDGAAISFGQSQSYSTSWEFSLTTSEINAILASLGGSYTTTASSDTYFGTTFNVGPNKIARVRFAPTKRYSYGTLTTWRQLEGELNPRIIATKTTTNNIVKKVGSWADGLYYLEYQ